MKRTAIERLLPEVIRATAVDGTPLAALLDVMERLHAPAEAVLQDLDAYFDPHRTDDRFVVLLSRWVDLERLFLRSAAARDDDVEREPISSGTGRLRELVARAAYLSQWRGTRQGLLAFLETATGEFGFGIDECVLDGQGQVRPFHIRVSVPAAAAAHRALIERIVELEKPAHVTCDFDIPSNGA